MKRNEHRAEPRTLAQSRAEYLGPRAEVVFPGSEVAWRALHSEGSQDLIGKFTIFTSLQDGSRVPNEKVVNIADGVTT
jgi:hypothetical protein